jgi:S1-C subfamily serine protease
VEKAGLQQGDVILKIDGQQIKNPADLVSYVKGLKIGQRIVLLVQRQEKPCTYRWRLKRRPFRNNFFRCRKPRVSGEDDSGAVHLHV